MSTIRDTKILFDKSSIHATEYSLQFFSFRHQVTIQAVNLHPEDEITFEVIHLESGTPAEICGCFIKPGDLPRIAGIETLLCYECDDGEEGAAPLPVRVTVDNPVVVLNGPQNVVFRAKYNGPGLGTSQVWATLETDTIELRVGMDGCPPVCCVHDPESWREIGPRRCNLDTDKLEALMVDNCGNEEWQEIDDLNWQDTGSFRCTTEADGTQTDEIEKQQKNDCGDVRWVEDDRGMVWTPTGVTRCNMDFGQGKDNPMDAGTIDRQESNQCGDLRWVDDQGQTWVATGEIECRDFDVLIPTGGGNDGERWVKESNNCGDTRWVFDRALVWVPTGLVRNAGDTTGDTYNVEVQEINECGDLRWAAAGTLDWVDTGQTRPVFGSEDDNEKEQRDVNGATRWVPDNGQQWFDTGRIRSDGQDGIERKEVNQYGHIRWVFVEDAEWLDTGLTRCFEHKEQRQQVDQAGTTRWFEDEENCGYMCYAATGLPGGGFIYGPNQTVRDPDATVELKDCEDGIIGYAYPEPQPGATTQIVQAGDAYCGCYDPTSDIIGYAVNDCMACADC